MIENRYSEVLFVYEDGAKTELRTAEGKVFEFSIANGRLIANEVPIDVTNSVPFDVSTQEDDEEDEEDVIYYDKYDDVDIYSNSVPSDVSTQEDDEEDEYDDVDIYSELPNISAGEYAEVLSGYTDNAGNKAVVPQGWTVSGVPSENVIWGKDIGLVIYYIPKEKVSGIDWRNKKKVNELMETYDQLVWNPVKMLSASSTLDGHHFNEKFGRIHYSWNDDFQKGKYNESLEGELLSQKESIDMYGGYYSTRYNISKDKKTGKPRSVIGAMPWTGIDVQTAKQVSSTMIVTKDVKSHLMYGAEYDTIEKWLIESKTKYVEEIASDSTNLGNYCNNTNYKDVVDIVTNGKDGCICNLYGFAGNILKLTQERYKKEEHVMRGGSYKEKGTEYPITYRCNVMLNCERYDAGFRVAILINKRLP